jgi:hypothetical protein
MVVNKSRHNAGGVSQFLTAKTTRCYAARTAAVAAAEAAAFFSARGALIEKDL